ncbi:AMP-dependent synthetase/ligase [Tanacetum coccineum]
MTDFDDIKDMEMIMQQLRYEQEQEAESSHRRNYIYREREEAEERLMAYYFGAHPKYPSYYFRKRYRMNRKLFLEIVAGFSVIMKCTCAIGQLAYGVTPDSLDEYLQMGVHLGDFSRIIVGFYSINGLKSGKVEVHDNAVVGSQSILLPGSVVNNDVILGVLLVAPIHSVIKRGGVYMVKSRYSHRIGVNGKGVLNIYDDIKGLPNHKIFHLGTRYSVIVRHSNGLRSYDDARLNARGAVRMLSKET